MTSMTSKTGDLADDAAATARLTIDLGAIADNWRTMRDLSGEATCGAAVKGNAYGTGMAEAAPVLAKAGCRHRQPRWWTQPVRAMPSVPAC